MSRRAPTSALVVLVLSFVLLEHTVISVVGERQADRVWRTLLFLVARTSALHGVPFVCLRLAILAVLVPHDEIQAFTLSEIVCAVSSISCVHHAAAFHVLVHKARLAVLRAALVAAELQAGALEISAHTHIESNITVIAMNIKTQILINLVSYDERMVMVEMRAHTWEKQPSNRLKVFLLQHVKHGFHTNFIHNDAVVVH
mmetsp:Transcript_16599/g.30810  ORF Transcript_16599/g.30810 Transcript_16599/m.30810 type:complete len:200 (+) Transcript_16599:189-788(+)